MKRFVSSELRKFLRSLDRHLPGPFSLIVIGGAAASLTLDPKKATVDIDTANKVGTIQGACNAAREETGLRIPLAFATTYEAPRSYEHRLKHILLPGLKRLKLLAPEKHDWALMKMARLAEKDIEDVKAVFRIRGFSKDVLLERFRTEMVGPGRPTDRLAIHFLAMVEKLWGPAEATRMEQAIRRP
jgi:hypothetical protein